MNASVIKSHRPHRGRPLNPRAQTAVDMWTTRGVAHIVHSAPIKSWRAALATARLEGALARRNSGVPMTERADSST